MAESISVTTTWSKRLTHVEYLLVCALAVVLPILETPKNLALFLLLVVWAARRVVSGGFRLRRPDIIEVSLLILLGTTVVSTVLNWPLVNGLKGFKDIFSQVLVFWLIYRAAYSDRQQLRIVEMVAVGVMVGLAWGIAEVVRGRLVQLEFHSAGIVTQSAVYLGITISAAFSVAWTRSMATSSFRVGSAETLWWLAMAIMLVCLFLMGSRGAILAILVTGVVYALAIGRRSLWFAIAGFVIAGAVLTMALPDWFSQSRWLTKTHEMALTQRLVQADQERYDNWRIAASRIAQGDALLFGIGPHNFAAIDHTKMSFNPPLAIGAGRLNHAHNLFLNKLVEEGVFGLAALLFFFGVVVTRLVRDRRTGHWRRWPWFAALGALAVPVIAGLFNTPWYQEHALLAMILLAIYLSPHSTHG
jgi:O-antigen ligase